MNSWKRLWVLSLALVGVGCGLREWDSTDGADEVDLAQDESALVSSQTEEGEEADGACSNLAPEALAERAAQRAKERFNPPSCVKATAAGATVTYQMQGCSGRFGLAQATGTLTATFSKDSAGLHVEVKGDDVKVRRAVVDVSAKGTCTASAGKRLWTVSSVASGQGVRGAALDHRGDYTILVDPVAKCREVDGKWVQHRNAQERTLTITDLARCAGECPKAGGVIDFKRFNGETLTVTFDGSSTAQWSTSEGEAGTRKLQCGAATP